MNTRDLCVKFNTLWLRFGLKSLKSNRLGLRILSFIYFIIMYDKLFKKKIYFNWGYNL
jgi:hypothetical protein